MGTRADFYVGFGRDAEWIGSIAYDGYPDGNPEIVLGSKTEEEFRSNFNKMLEEVDHGTTPDQGWPWPWDNSGTTDYSYWFNDGEVIIDPDYNEDTDEYNRNIDYPDMSDKKNVTFGPRSGLLIISGM